MSDVVFLAGLDLQCVIGVHDWERRSPRPLRVDLELECDCAPASATDDLRLALDYQAVAESVVRRATGTSHLLVECLAEQVADDLLASFPGVAAVRVRVTKPAPLPGLAAAGVEIVRRREATSA